MSTILCITFIACLSWASLDLPKFGTETSPLQTHLTEYYIEPPPAEFYDKNVRKNKVYIDKNMQT